MEKETRKLQQYADLHHNGDVKKAIYDLVYHGEKSDFHQYVEEMTEEEATFSLDLVEFSVIRKLGGLENYRKAHKAEQLAGIIGVSADDIQPDTPNPFRKPLIRGFLLLLCAIVLPVILVAVLRNMQMGYSWILAAQSICIGLCAMHMATALLHFFRFRKMKKLLAELPDPDREVPQPTFEECLAFCAEKYRNVKIIPPANASDATTVLDAARKANWMAFGLLFVMGILLLIGIVISSMSGIVGGLASAAVIAAFGIWQIVTVFKATLKTRDAVLGVSKKDPACEGLNQRQNLCVLSMILLAGAYILATFAGALICIFLGAAA